MTVSIVFFTINLEESGDGLEKPKNPYETVFTWTTIMRYATLIGSKTHKILNVQQSRGINPRPTRECAVNFMALLMLLLVQSFLPSCDFAMTMETTGLSGRCKKG